MLSEKINIKLIPKVVFDNENVLMLIVLNVNKLIKRMSSCNSLILLKTDNSRIRDFETQSENPAL